MPRGRPKVPRVTVTCTTCGKQTEKYLAQVRENKSGRFFCSSACRGQAGRPRTAPRRDCEQCGAEFVAYGVKARATGRFCSKACYDKWQRRNRIERTCEWCSVTFDRPPAYESRQAARFCSRKCEAASRIKRAIGREHNGKPAVLDRNGYVRVYQPDHPRATRGGWQFEHRIVVERELGRYLKPDEHVHHVNGQKDDNRLVNLEVLSHGAHSTITWAGRQAKIQAMETDIEEYRRRFGDLEKHRQEGIATP